VTPTPSWARIIDLRRDAHVRGAKNRNAHVRILMPRPAAASSRRADESSRFWNGELGYWSRQRLLRHGGVGR